MQYLGGKARIWKHIVEFLEDIRLKDQVYFEPFVGGAWVLSGMSGDRIATDANIALVSLYRSLQEGWIPPDSVSEETYQFYKKHQDYNDPMTAFCGFGCSFGGIWFSGYARSGSRNYALNAKNSLLRKAKKLNGVRFINGTSYENHKPSGYLIYCDPPYANTAGYGAVGSFDHDKFWNTMREWSKLNTVVISEYSAPDDFICVKEIITKTDMHTKTGKQRRIEKLFMFNH